MTSGNILNGNIVHFNPYKRNMNLLLKEPPLKKGESVLLQKNAVQELWMEQKLNHFDDKNNETWLMRYFLNDRYFQTNGPVFIFVGGEWEITPAYLLTGHMHDIAKQHKGMLYYVEHRYYGQSWPTSDYEAESLQYLSARQSLADLAHFIRELRTSEGMNSDKRIILTGASYSGSLVAWFAKLYPNLVSAGWASSAPLLARKDFYEYMHQVGNVIQHRGGAACTEKLESGLVGIANLFESSNASQLLKGLRVCQNFDPTSRLDRAALFNAIGNYFATFAQLYDNQIPNICAALTNKSNGNDLTAFIEFLKQIFWPTHFERTGYEDFCIDLSYDAMKSIFTDYSDRLGGTQQWFYQSCHEFGWFATTNTSTKSFVGRKVAASQLPSPRRHEQPSQFQHSFGRQVPLRYFEQLCLDVFGKLSAASTFKVDDISANIQQTNNYFGGLSAAATLQQKVIFTHGQLDPWRAVGVQHGINVISITDYTHTADLDSIDFNDSVEMNVAKLKVAAFLRRALRTKT
ncbi:thymus-specific serine protease isoform X2 [Eurosta solidaginis]